MAKFKFDGIDYISAQFEQLAQIDDDDKMSVIMPAAEYLRDKHQEALRTVFRKLSGVLSQSVRIQRKTDENGAYAHIYPKGKHPGSGTGRRRGKRRSNGHYSGTNAEIAYILEYGSPRIAASHWMENANEEAEGEIIALQQEAWNDLLTKKGL